MEKLYCYVDETGQHTEGALFVVSVVIARENRDEVEQLLEQIERETGKRSAKWMKTRFDIRQEYLHRVFAEPIFKGCLFYAKTEGTRHYKPLTLVAIASAVQACRHTSHYKASVFIDGLKKPEQRAVSTGLHRIGVITEKVRGVTDESSAFIRLADAVAGLVREAEEGQFSSRLLRRQGEASGFLRLV
ncbi:hypothetical protein IAD21_06020 [Abditibacteriota bacterium]|nr:hypothetical protein IAD21_06020 [Abditibacteriota bacterium]